jgi:hypothetical protein
MKRLLWAVGVVVCLCGGARAETKPATWLRRATVAAACAASFWDMQTTRTGVRYGGREGNAFLADAQGRPRWGRMAGVKAGLCGGMMLAQELGARRTGKSKASYAWAGTNAALAARFLSVSLQNRRATAVLKQERRGPGYLVNPD